jgi:hypothetical protein
MDRTTLITRLEVAARALSDHSLIGFISLAETAARIQNPAATAEAVPSGEHPEFARIARLLGDVEYGRNTGWRVAPDGSWLQVVRFADATKAGDSASLFGRKWRLSPHMVRAEVVQTAFAAVRAFEEHEARELFRWRGRAVFGPHIDLDALHGACVSTEARPSQEAI